jgi:tetratricopeptide (TPR) repeat protein
VLQARLDRLPPYEKRLVQTAAVIGSELPVPLLHRLAELPEDMLQRGLAHLQDREFLYEMHLFPEHTYTFKHALTREVAYSSLLQERRCALHRQVVEALESLYPDRLGEYTERLAYHALHGEVWEKAVPYSQQAGARAFERAAFHEAVVYFDQAFEALTHLRECGDARVLAIEISLALDWPLNALGEYERRLSLLREAEAMARALDDRPRLIRVLAKMAQLFRITGERDGAIAVGQQALELAAELGDSALEGEAAQHLGEAYYATGDFGRATELLRRSVVAADRESGRSGTTLQIRSRAWLALTLSALGEFAQGERHGEEALRLAIMEEREARLIMVYVRLGHLYLTQGNLEAASRVFEAGLALCRASGNSGPLWAIVGGLGEAYAHTGRLAEGLMLLEEACRDDLRTGALGAQYVSHLRQLSAVYLLAGGFNEAWRHACQALDRARQLKAYGEEALALFQLGAVHAQDSPPDVQQAEECYREALLLAETLGMRPLQAHCHRDLGTLYAKTGRAEEARTSLVTAIELYRAMEMTFWLPQAEAALAEVEGASITSGRG